MLINKNTPKEGELTGLKLTSGEELIGTVVSISDKDVTVQQPCQLGQNEKGVGLMPAMMMADEDKPVMFYLQCVVAFYEPDADFVSAYNAFTSKLTLPKTQKIIT